MATEVARLDATDQDRVRPSRISEKPHARRRFRRVPWHMPCEIGVPSAPTWAEHEDRFAPSCALPATPRRRPTAMASPPTPMTEHAGMIVGRPNRPFDRQARRLGKLPPVRFRDRSARPGIAREGRMGLGRRRREPSLLPMGGCLKEGLWPFLHGVSLRGAACPLSSAMRAGRSGPWRASSKAKATGGGCRLSPATCYQSGPCRSS